MDDEVLRLAFGYAVVDTSHFLSQLGELLPWWFLQSLSGCVFV